MTRLERTIKLIDNFDALASMAILGDIDKVAAYRWLEELRTEKCKLFEELREHGCRRER